MRLNDNFSDLICPFLNIGEMTVFFQSCGNLPSLYEQLNGNARGLAMADAVLLRNMG